MPTSQDLVPTGQPYGDREKNVAALEAAGQPLSSGQGAPGNVVSLPGAAPPQPQPNRGTGENLSNFDVFQNREPSGVIPPPDAPDLLTLFQSRAAQTENPAMLYYLGRTSEFLE